MVRFIWSRGEFFLTILVLLAAVSSDQVLAQSGRKTKHSTKSSATRAKPGPGPIADAPRRTHTTVPANQTKAPSSRKETTGEVDSSDVVRISSNLVPVPATVIDARGNAITDLRLEDFELRVDGVLREISELNRSESAVRLAMLFDNSGSLDASRELEKQAAMRFFRRVLRAVDEAAIYSVETESYLAQALTRDIGRLEQTIASFGKPEGSTSLFDAIIDAAAYLRPYDGRRVIVIVSDGAETTSRADFETTIQHVLADDCQIFVVQTGLYDNANVRALAAERRMQDLAAQTGGAVYVPGVTADLDGAFKQIAADLAQQYILSYYASEERRDGQYHVINLRIKTRRDIRVRSRKGYYSKTLANVTGAIRNPTRALSPGVCED
jgi:Ca-activated chloride channel homolog